MDLALAPVVAESDWRDYHAIRRAVLWEDRGRTGYDDRHGDEHLPDHHPLLLRLDGRAIGTTRLDDRRDGTAVVRLVAVARDRQRLGHGRAMGGLVEDVARRLGIGTLLVNAAPDAEGFYAAMGWHRFVWDATELVGIAVNCVQMRKFVTV